MRNFTVIFRWKHSGPSAYVYEAENRLAAARVALKYMDEVTRARLVELRVVDEGRVYPVKPSKALLRLGWVNAGSLLGVVT